MKSSTHEYIKHSNIDLDGRNQPRLTDSQFQANTNVAGRSRSENRQMGNQWVEKSPGPLV